MPSKKVEDPNQTKKSSGEGRSVAETPEKTVNPQVVISFTILFIFAVFAAINTREVSINFLFAEANLPLIIVILGSYILGVITVIATRWRKGKK